jgi:CHAD domain-containing protein
MIEREVKLTLPGRFAIPALALDGAQLDAQPLPDLALRATYYDTADLRLARHGVTLRYRTGDEGGARWTLKLPVSVTGSGLERNELEFRGPPRDPPDDARRLVTAYARQDALVAVATLRTRRRRIRLAAGEVPVAEIADDEVSVVEGRRVVSRFRELEIEGLADDVDLAGLATQLRDAGATEAEPIPKVVRALGSRATAPADVRAVSLPAVPSLADVLSFALADALVRLVRNDPMARLGDPEGTHQVRVALRRLRSDLRTLGDAVDDGWRTRITRELREAGDALGAARDLDVLVDHLAAEVDGRRRALAPLFTGLRARSVRAREQAVAALNGPGYPPLLDALLEAVASPPAGPRGSEPAADELPALVMATWRRLSRRADRLEPGSPEDAFHATRIAAKRTRYAAELAARVLGGKASRGAKALAEQMAGIQDSLGRAQDAVVAEATIRGSLERKVSQRYAFEAGRLVERFAARGTEARFEFLDRWPEARRGRWRRWA